MLNAYYNSDVAHAIIKLDDALCMWEAITGKQSVFILREEGGFVHRAMNGKPIIQEDVSDVQLLLSAADSRYLPKVSNTPSQDLVMAKRRPVLTGILDPQWIRWAKNMRSEVWRDPRRHSGRRHSGWRD